MPVVCVAVYGPPACGKSTLVGRLRTRIAVERPVDSVAVVEFDSYLHQRMLENTIQGKPAFHPADFQAASDAFLQEIDSAIKTSAATASLGATSVIFCVDNMYFESMRRRLLAVVEKVNAAADSQVGFASVCVECDMELALRRNETRTGFGKVSASVIQKMFTALERGPARRQRAGTDFGFTTDSTSDDAANTFSSFEDLMFHHVLPAGAAFCPALPERTPAAPIITASTLHQMDLDLRRYAASLMQMAGLNLKGAHKKQTLGYIGEALAAAKQTAMQEARQSADDAVDMEQLVGVAKLSMDRVLNSHAIVND